MPAVRRTTQKIGRKSVDTMSDASNLDAKTSEVLGLTTEIVAAHVSNNTVAMSDLPNLIEQVYKTLSNVDKGLETQSERPTPAVSLRKSVTPEYIICLEDGKKLKMLKRHLMTHYQMTPADYRSKWNLPADYPMVAPNYAEQRRTLAKSIGLGSKPKGSSAAASAKATKSAPVRRGSPKSTEGQPA